MTPKKKAHKRLQDAIGILHDLVDVLFESHNCPDCMVEYKRIWKGKVLRHKKSCRFAKAIRFLSEGKVKP